MRDLLTLVAGLVVLVLAAALALPPLIPWEGQRGAVDRALARATGLEARTEGRIGLRLLPSPRLSVDALHLGGGAAGPSLDARGVEAEVALAPLLQGVLHFTEARAARAEVKVSLARDGRPVLSGLGGMRPPDLALEDLRIDELLLTRVALATGRTDQVVAQDVHVTASALIGPWQVEGSHAGAPFRLTTGTIDAAGTIPLKLEAGGDTAPRLEVDARVSLPDDGGLPTAEGAFKLVVGPPSQAAGPYVPLVLQGKIATQGALVRLDALVLDVDQGGAALRLNGRGSVDLGAASASLILDARRLDLDAFLLSPSGRAFIERRGTGLLPPLPIDLTLGVESANLVAEEWTALGLAARLDPDGAVTLRRLAATAPGGARLQAEGEAGIGPSRSFTGHVQLVAPQPARLARMLERVGVSGPFPLLDAGRPLDIAGDVTFAPPVMALRNARLALGEARVTGSARYTGAEAAGGARGRFDAQVSAQGVDVADLPPLRDLATGLGGLDLGLQISATDLRYGPAGAATRGGRLTADIRSDGAALRIDGLEITNLAGANARASGRIAPDGTGRIAGRVTAPRAAPLLDLVTAAWSGMPRRLPGALRDGALDLEVSAERADDASPRLALTANGRAAGATVQARLGLAQGRAETFSLDATTADAAAWLGRAGDATLAKPGTLHLVGTRREGRMTVEGQGSVADLRLATAAPLALAEDGLPEAGTLTLAGADAAPFAGLLGEGVRVPAPLPVDLRLSVSRGKDAPVRLALTGRAADTAVAADLTRAGEALSGTLALDRLALPRLLDALALAPEPEARAATGPWPTARFRVARPAIVGELAVTAASLDLGRGLVAREASFTLASTPDALVLREGRARLGEGLLAGTLALARQEGQVGLTGEVRTENLALATLTGASPPVAAGRAVEGRLSGRLRFGASGVSAAALVANLAGEGEVRLAGLRAPGGDAEGLSRTVARLLREDDPLRAGRAQDVAAEEFSRGPLRVVSEAAAPTLLVGGSLRMAPLAFDLGPASWQGSASYDLRTARLDARGTLALREAPRGWTGPPPALTLGYGGPLADPVRSLDVGPLTTGLAAVVLKRELDTIELYEEDQSERLRRQRQRDMDRARDAEAARRAAEAARALQGATQGSADTNAVPAQP